MVRKPKSIPPASDPGEWIGKSQDKHTSPAPAPKRKRYKKYGYEKLIQGKIAYTYKIIELGKKDSDPFPHLRIPIDPKLVADALNEAHFQGYKGMAETLHEITKGVIDG